MKLIAKRFAFISCFLGAALSIVEVVVRAAMQRVVCQTTA